ncbi:MAG: FHA domain-containing protein [Pseudomonadota bacterium]
MPMTDKLAQHPSGSSNMEDKSKILQTLFPKAVLKALTRESLQAIPAGMQIDGMVVIHAFPFRVGRESRVTVINGRIHRIERPNVGDVKPTNEMYLLDAGDLLQVSREHFQIEQTADGYVVTDRGSKCGVTVAGKRIGAGTGVKSAPVVDGDLIAIGTSETNYLFSFIAGFDKSHW